MSAVPAPGFYPNIYLPPFSRMYLISLQNWSIFSGTFVLPIWVSVPAHGKLTIIISVSEAGTFQLYTNYNTYVSWTLNGGNALNANTLYEFTLDLAAGTAINFMWVSSSSSVTSANINMIVFVDLEEEESGSG